MGTPRILVLTSTFPARADDGTPAFISDLSKELGKEFRVRILTPAVPHAPATEQLTENVDVVRYRYFPARWEDLADGAILENVRARHTRLLQVPFLLGALGRAVRAQERTFRPDAIHAHWIIPQGIVARRVAAKKPTVVTTLGGDLYALNSSIARSLKSDVLRHARAVTVMNADMQQRAISLDANPLTTHIMPMGARLTTLDRAPAPTVTGEGPLRLLAVGRLVPKKGFDVLLRALQDVDFAFTLEIVGDGPERDVLEQCAAGLPVSFAGQLTRDELASRYIASDMAVFPSLRAESGDQDGLPVAMLEAMGAGCAIVASDLPGLNEAIEHERSGVLVPEKNPAALTKALNALARDPRARLVLSDNARARARAYSVESTGEQYRTLFRSVLTR